MKNILGLATGAVLVLAVGLVAAPDATANILSRLGNTVEDLSTVDCDKQPVACLEQKQEQLADVNQKMDSALQNMSREHKRAREIAQQQRRLKSQNELFLNEGRSLYASGSEQVEFVGETYDRVSLEAQLELLFLEGQRLNDVVRETQGTVSAIASAKTELLSRRAGVQATLAILPAKIASAKARAVYEGFKTDIDLIDGILSDGRSTLTVVEPLMRTTSDLTDAQARPDSGNEVFTAWLSSGAAGN